MAGSADFSALQQIKIEDFSPGIFSNWGGASPPIIPGACTENTYGCIAMLGGGGLRPLPGPQRPYYAESNIQVKNDHLYNAATWHVSTNYEGIGQALDPDAAKLRIALLDADILSNSVADGAVGWEKYRAFARLSQVDTDLVFTLTANRFAYTFPNYRLYNSGNLYSIAGDTYKIGNFLWAKSSGPTFTSKVVYGTGGLSLPLAFASGSLDLLKNTTVPGAALGALTSIRSQMFYHIYNGESMLASGGVATAIPGVETTYAVRTGNYNMSAGSNWGVFAGSSPGIGVATTPPGIGYVDYALALSLHHPLHSFVHQGRLIYVAGDEWNATLGYTTVLDRYVASDSTLFNSFPADLSKLDAPVFIYTTGVMGIGAFYSISSQELLIIGMAGGAYLVQGDIQNPTVRNLPGVQSTYGISAHGAATSSGFAYLTTHGVYVWQGADSSICISKQLLPMFWESRAERLKLANFGRLCYWQGKLFVPNNYLYDEQLKSWWRLAPVYQAASGTFITTPTGHFQRLYSYYVTSPSTGCLKAFPGAYELHDTSYPNDEACSDVYDIFDEAVPASCWNWEGVALPATVGRFINPKQLQVSFSVPTSYNVNVRIYVNGIMQNGQMSTYQHNLTLTPSATGHIATYLIDLVNVPTLTHVSLSFYVETTAGAPASSLFAPVILFAEETSLLVRTPSTSVVALSLAPGNVDA